MVANYGRTTYKCVFLHTKSMRHTILSSAGEMASKFGLWLALLALCLVCLPFHGNGDCTRTGDLYTATISECYSAYYNLACCENSGLCTVYSYASVVTCPSATRLPACCSP